MLGLLPKGNWYCQKKLKKNPKKPTRFSSYFFNKYWVLTRQ